MVQIAVIGLGRYGSSLALKLSELGGDVIAIDKREPRTEAIKDRVAEAITLDATDEGALRDIGIAEVDAAVVGIGQNIEENIMVTTLLRRMGVTRVISRAMSNLHAKILEEVGATRVIRIEEQMGEEVARLLIAPHILQHIRFASGYSLVELKPIKEFIGQTIEELRFRQKYQVNIAALQKRIRSIDEDGKSIFKIETKSPPDPNDIVGENDILVLVGMDSAIYEFTK